MRFTSASLLLLALSFVATDAYAEPSIGGSRRGGAAQREAEDGASDKVLKRLTELEQRMEKIRTKKAYAELFESTNRDVLWFQTHFSRAQKAAHDAAEGLKKGGAIDYTQADALHNALREYLINLEELPPNHAFGATKSPDKGTKKKLIGEIQGLVDYANKTPGLEDIDQADLSSDSVALEAVIYGKRHLTEIYRLTGNRTLTFFSAQAGSNSRDVIAALDEAGAALDALVDVDGKRIVQLDEDGRPLPDQLSRLKAALAEAKVQAEFFKSNYQPHQWRDAQRRRADMIIDKLSRDGFIKRLSAVKALNEIPLARAEGEAGLRR